MTQKAQGELVCVSIHVILCMCVCRNKVGVYFCWKMSGILLHFLLALKVIEPQVLARSQTQTHMQKLTQPRLQRDCEEAQSST